MKDRKGLLTVVLAVLLGISLILSAVSMGLVVQMRQEKGGASGEEPEKLLNILAGDRKASNLSWVGKTWCSYGDSIVQEEKWQTYVTDYFGFSKFYNRGIGSSTFSKNEQTWYANPDGSYNSRFGFAGVSERPEGTTEHEGYFCSSDRIDVSVPEDADLIVIMGGTNDMGSNVPIGDLSYPFDEATFQGAVAATVVKIQAKAPRAVVVLASPLSGRGPEPEEGEEAPLNGDAQEFVYNDLGLTTEDYRDAMEEVATALSIPFIDVFGTTGINQWNRSQYLRDIVHPADTGGMAIARSVIGGLEQIKPNPMNQYTVTEGYRLADSASVREAGDGSLSAELNEIVWRREVEEERVLLTAALPARGAGLNTGVFSLKLSNKDYFEDFSLELSSDGQNWEKLVLGLDYEIWGDTLWTGMADREIGWIRIGHGRTCEGGCGYQLLFYEPETQKKGFHSGSKVKNVRSTVNNAELERILDHDESTRWTSGSAQEEGTWIMAQLTEPCTLNGVHLGVGDSIGDYPYDLIIEVSDDGKNWKSCDAKSSDQIDFTFSPVSGTYIRMTLGKIPADVMANWSIHEMTLYQSAEPAEQ